MKHTNFGGSSDDEDKDSILCSNESGSVASSDNENTNEYNSSTVSETSESEILTSLAQQDDYYNCAEKEIHSEDTEKTIQKYLKKIYRNVKFLSESGKEFKEPSFVSHPHGKKVQAVDICEYLWKCLGK